MYYIYPTLSEIRDIIAFVPAALGNDRMNFPLSFRVTLALHLCCIITASVQQSVLIPLAHRLQEKKTSEFSKIISLQGGEGSKERPAGKMDCAK